MIYRPLYVDKIMAYVDTPFVKILTGVRRCGKSTIKLADPAHNSDLSRLDQIDDRALDRVNKYKQAIFILERDERQAELIPKLGLRASEILL